MSLLLGKNILYLILGEAFKKKYLIFNSWRNITNSFKKNKLKLINNQKFLEESKKIKEKISYI